MREFATQKVDEVCVFGSSRPRIKKKKRERVEMTNLDACWSMHGGMGCINEVAISQVNSSSLEFGLGPRFGEEKKRFLRFIAPKPILELG